MFQFVGPSSRPGLAAAVAVAIVDVAVSAAVGGTGFHHLIKTNHSENKTKIRGVIS